METLIIGQTKLIPNTDNKYAVTIHGDIVSYCFKTPRIIHPDVIGIHPCLIRKSIDDFLCNIVWDTFHNYEDRTGFYVENIDGDVMNCSLDNLELRPIEIFNSVEELEHYETILSDSDLIYERNFQNYLLSLSIDERESYIKRINRVKCYPNMDKVLNKMGYPKSY